MARGCFLSIEGGEGVGKTTLASVLSERLAARGLTVTRTREPGGTPLAESIRELVLGDHGSEIVAETTELLLMFAARTQNVNEVIRPALERGEWVVCDRFTDATLAYQGAARGMPERRIRMLAEWVHGDLWPDLTLLLTAPDAVLAERLAARSSGPDRIEAESRRFFDRVREGYEALAEAEPDRYRVIDTSQPLTEMGSELDRIIDAWLRAQDRRSIGND